ncbi:MAG: response regulator, partial [Rhodospirillales bacterium]|nr:response regulator [Rhodospirillales bacterium]
MMQKLKPAESTQKSEIESPRRLLVAEDEHLLAQHLEADLKELGFEVIGPASNGKRAVDLAREQKPDMALLDLRMPEMDGFQAGEILYLELGVPIIVVSAYSDREYIERMRQLGVFGYLLKPVSLDELRVTISVGWSRFRQQQE